jgi:hypothetical protein
VLANSPLRSPRRNPGPKPYNFSSKRDRKPSFTLAARLAPALPAKYAADWRMTAIASHPASHHRRSGKARFSRNARSMIRLKIPAWAISSRPAARPNPTAVPKTRQWGRASPNRRWWISTSGSPVHSGPASGRPNSSNPGRPARRAPGSKPRSSSLAGCTGWRRRCKSSG